MSSLGTLKPQFPKAKYYSADAPTTAVGTVKDLHVRYTTGELFVCVDSAAGVATWLGTLGSAVAVITSPLSPDLSSMYDMDNIVGSTLVDASGSGFDGNIKGTTNLPGPNGGNALSFNGSSDYIDIGAALLPDTGDFTLSFWLEGSPTSAGAVYSQFSLASILVTRMQLVLDTTSLTFQAGSGGSVSTPGGSTYAAGWNLYTFVRASGNLSIYRNTTLLASGTISNILQTGGIIGCRTNSTGAYNDPPLTNFFGGAIAQFRVFGRALSIGEITELVNE